MFGSTSLYWLAQAVSIRRDRVMRLLRRMTGLGPRGGMTPPVFGKFLRLLDQIALERQEEERFLSRIADIESRHRYQRRHGKLARPGLEAKPGPGWWPGLANNRVRPANTPTKKRNSLFAFFALVLRPRLK